MAPRYRESNPPQSFINPYNFVRIQDNAPVKSSFESARGPRTGWLECRLDVLTPLFVRGAKKQANGRESLEFFAYPGSQVPVIPGSELRGMIRAAYEAVSNSCLSTTDDRQILYKRTTVPARPGLLQRKVGKAGGKATWEIQPCLREPYVAGKVEEGHRVGKSCVHFGEPFPGKHQNDALFEPDPSAKPFAIPETAVANLRENLRLYNDPTVNLHRKRGHSGYQHMPKVDPDDELAIFDKALIYYAERNGVYYLSPAQIGREVFHNQLSHLIPDHRPCTDIEKLCPACALFGFAKETAAASRVRFGDARIKPEEPMATACFPPDAPLPELSSPKPSATEFYLQKPDGDADLWNYDYALRWDRTGRSPIANILPDYKPRIRGRKFYWHQRIDRPPTAPGRTDETRSVTVGALRPSKIFKFRIYFDHVSDTELKRLIWVLTLGGGKRQAHKLGMGKPVGMGSVRIDVEKVILRTLTRDQANRTILRVEEPGSPSDHRVENPVKEFGWSGEVLDDFLDMTEVRTPAPGAPIQYPTNVGSTKVYEWFVANRTVKGTGTAPKIDQVLRELEDPDPLQIKYEMVPDTGQRGGAPGRQGPGGQKPGGRRR